MEKEGTSFFLYYMKRSGRLPTLWFEKRSVEKSFMTPRTRRIKELIDLSQHTQIKEVIKKQLFH